MTTPQFRILAPPLDRPYGNAEKRGQVFVAALQGA
jgi:hypothetical protein